MLNNEQLSRLMKAGNDINLDLKLASQFSEDVLNTAINSYAQEARQEAVYAMRTVGFSNSGKKGYLLTSEAIYHPDFSFIKFKSSGLNRLPLEGIINIAPYDQKHFHVAEYRNGERIIFWAGSVWEESVLALLREAIKIEAENTEGSKEREG